MPSGQQPYALDMAAVRATAASFPGGKASEIRVESVAQFSFPATAIAAGEWWNSVPLAALSYQVVLPVDRIVIDTGFVEGQGADLAPTYDDAAIARMRAAMASATQIVVTHEHLDHIGGLVAGYAADPGLARAVRLTSVQLANVDNYEPGWGKVLDGLAPLADGGENYLAIAPGVVLIRAPGHTPGSQMVFVQRADGRELLFVGDIAWTMRNIETGQGRPRLMSEFMLHEDRNAVYAELATLKALHESEPALLMVPGHDPAAVAALVASGALTAEFRP